MPNAHMCFSHLHAQRIRVLLSSPCPTHTCASLISMPNAYMCFSHLHAQRIHVLLSSPCPMHPLMHKGTFGRTCSPQVHGRGSSHPTPLTDRPLSGQWCTCPHQTCLLLRMMMMMMHRTCLPSRCTRQRLWDLLHKRKAEWLHQRRVNIVFGGHQEAPGDYSDLLSRSKFCLVLTG